MPPRAPTPPPLIIKQREPTPPTPPPLILREAPPPLPPRQEATVITKVLPAEPAPAPQVIIEREPAVISITPDIPLLTLQLSILVAAKTSIRDHRKMATLQNSPTARSDSRTRLRRREDSTQLRKLLASCSSTASSLG